MKKALVAIGDFESGKKLIKQVLDLYCDWVTEIHLLNVIDKENLENVASYRSVTVEELLKQYQMEYDNIPEFILWD